MDSLLTQIALRVTPRVGRQLSGKLVDLLQQHIND
jgi:hypothetical protein